MQAIVCDVQVEVSKSESIPMIKVSEVFKLLLKRSVELPGSELIL